MKTLVIYLLDIIQVVMAAAVLYRALRHLRQMVREYQSLTPPQLRILIERERYGFSPKTRMMALIGVVTVFTIPQVEWLLNGSSAALSFGDDFTWFAVGMVVLHYLWSDVDALTSVWRMRTRFRDDPPLCQTGGCRVCMKDNTAGEANDQNHG